MKLNPDDRASSEPGDRPLVKVIAALGLATLVFAIGANVLGVDQDEPARRWTFAEDAATPAALGFSLPVAEGGRWNLHDHTDATGGRALSNEGGEGVRPALALVGGVRSADVRTSTRCRSLRGEHHGCGLVFRLRDLDHHYVARIERGGTRVTLAVVRGGVEDVLAEADVEDSGDWHDLTVVAAGERLQVALDGAVVIEAVDGSLPRAGSVGMWSPARGTSTFDAFAVEPLRHPRGKLPGKPSASGRAAGAPDT